MFPDISDSTSIESTTEGDIRALDLLFKRIAERGRKYRSLNLTASSEIVDVHSITESEVIRNKQVKRKTVKE